MKPRTYISDYWVHGYQVINIILSCKTLEQLKVAKRVCKQWYDTCCVPYWDWRDNGDDQMVFIRTRDDIMHTKMKLTYDKKLSEINYEHIKEFQNRS
jgi:hypothetical protein